MKVAEDKHIGTGSHRDIRRQFPILNTEMNGHPLVFLDSAASSQKPESVIRAVDRYYRCSHANVHRGVYTLSQQATELYEGARESVRSFIDAGSTAEIIFTKGATDAINTLAFSFGSASLGAGDEVLITGMEHHSNIVPWQMACERSGAHLRVIPVLDNGEILLEEAVSMLTERTRLLAFVHISNTLGTVNPARELVSAAHQRGIPVLIDGSQAVPHMPVSVRQLDVDFYAFSGHKMYGPTGIGVLYGKRELLERLPPYQGGGEMIESVTFEKTTYNELPHRFEAGTPHIAGAVGLAAAIEFIRSIGFDRIQGHERELTAYATERLRSLPDLRIIGTAAEKAGVLSFLLEGAHPYDVGTILDKLGIAVRTGHHCTQPLMDRFCIPGTVRASLGIYNNRNDIDRLVSGLERAIGMLK